MTLTTSSAGMQLPTRADVKVRGVIVGQVNKAESEGKGATLTLGIKPDKIGQIPDNVTAALLPKTLFGEKYVELTIPRTTRPRPSLRTGDKIEQTELPVEVEKVLNDLYPLLRTVQPAELNYTLNALATALEGRGDKIGESLVTLDSYLKRLNPQIPDIIADIKLLGDGHRHLRRRVPRDRGHPAQHGEDRQHAGLEGGEAERVPQRPTAFSDTTKAFLDDNGDNIIRLGQLSEPILALLGRYSPEFPCLLEGMVQPGAAPGRHVPRLHLPHQPQDDAEPAPRLQRPDPRSTARTTGPNCAGLPSPPSPYYPSYKLPDLDDGVDDLGKVQPAPRHRARQPALRA